MGQRSELATCVGVQNPLYPDEAALESFGLIIPLAFRLIAFLGMAY
jgi:hypothetical protein